jgi:hypothetical protein
VVFALASPAGAVPQFQKAFQETYLKSLKDKKFAESMEKADVKCLVCHQGKQKKNRNEFGKVVGEFLTKKDAKKKEKIDEGLKEALAKHVDPKDDKSPTYLERLESSQWPGGKLDELKKDPKKPAGGAGEKKE